MSRPAVAADIDAYYLKGHTVAVIHSENLIRYPSLGKHLLASLAEAAHLGLEVGEGEIIIPLTDEEIARKIETEGRSWDFGKEAYEKYLNDGEWPKYTYLWDKYLTAEGIEAPTKPEDAK